MADPYVKFSIAAPDNIRGERGRFSAEGLQQLRSELEQTAQLVSYQVGNRIRNKVSFGPRAAASSGRLVAVTVSSRNIKVNKRVGSFSVGIGVTDYLDQSIAKYWRTFEEGSAATWRRPFIGTHLFAKYYKTDGFDFGRGRPSPHGTSLLTAKGPVSFKNSSADDLFIVKHEIAPAHSYKQVQEEAHLNLVNLQIARRFLDKTFNTPLKIFPPHGAPK